MCRLESMDFHELCQVPAGGFPSEGTLGDLANKSHLPAPLPCRMVPVSLPEPPQSVSTSSTTSSRVLQVPRQDVAETLHSCGCPSSCILCRSRASVQMGHPESMSPASSRALAPTSCSVSW